MRTHVAFNEQLGSACHLLLCPFLSLPLSLYCCLEVILFLEIAAIVCPLILCTLPSMKFIHNVEMQRA